jgi:anaerobic C4-dicarboxylate transporter
MIAMFSAVDGYFFLPTYPTLLAAISCDQTGCTMIGTYVLNHSFMLPGYRVVSSNWFCSCEDSVLMNHVCRSVQRSSAPGEAGAARDRDVIAL